MGMKVSQWKLSMVVIEFFGKINENSEVKLPEKNIVTTLNSNTTELHCFYRMLALYTFVREAPSAYDWSTRNAGTFFIKSLLALGKYSSDGTFRDRIVEQIMPK